MNSTAAANVIEGNPNPANKNQWLRALPPVRGAIMPAQKAQRNESVSLLAWK